MAVGQPPYANVHPMRVCLVHLYVSFTVCLIVILSSLPTLIQAIFMIPMKPPPTLPKPKEFSDEFNDFIAQCLVKFPDKRPSAVALLQVKNMCINVWTFLLLRQLTGLLIFTASIYSWCPYQSTGGSAGGRMYVSDSLE